MPTEPRECPIIFSGPMVRAILARQKTQTRRIVTGKTALRWLAPGMFTPAFVADPENGLSPYGFNGDRLWVRETFQENTPPSGYLYRADDVSGYIDSGWRPSIFMPRFASRLTLGVTEVRVQRLQEISEEDAIAEGVRCWVCGGRVDGSSEEDCACFHSKAAAVPSFQVLWDSINFKRASWDSNPWVWAIGFRLLEAH